jgi:glucokinase
VTQARRPPARRGGIDLGGTKIEAIVVDSGNTVLGSARRPTPLTGTPDDVAREMANAMHDAADAAGTQTDALIGVGVGSPGSVDAAKGTVSGASNLPGWEGTFPLAETLRQALGTRVRVGNDVAVATDAEFELGAAKPYRYVLGVFWGTGVGGGIILDGHPYHGRGAAGEIGHMVVKDGGRRCPCGNRGCMEAYAGRRAMESRARKEIDKGRKSDLFKIMEKKGRPRLTSSVWWDAIQRQDELATELIDEAIEAIGTATASACNLLDVEAVIIGGGLGVRFGQPYVDRIAAAMKPHVFPGHTMPDMHLAALGDLGGAIGAALLARRSRPASAQSR